MTCSGDSHGDADLLTFLPPIYRSQICCLDWVDCGKIHLGAAQSLWTQLACPLSGRLVFAQTLLVDVIAVIATCIFWSAEAFLLCIVLLTWASGLVLFKCLGTHASDVVVCTFGDSTAIGLEIRAEELDSWIRNFDE